MVAALIGLVSVIVGALLAGAVAYLNARRADARRQQASARLLEAELRSAARRLQWLRESLKPGALLDVTPAERREALRVFADGLSQQLWHEHRKALAEVLSSEDWYALVAAYDALDVLTNPASIEGFTRERKGLFGSAGDVWFVNHFVQNIEAGAAAVARLAGSIGHAYPPGHLYDEVFASTRSNASQRPRPAYAIRREEAESD
jgi:type II secretory pathway pseudopilin PulG